MDIAHKNAKKTIKPEGGLAAISLKRLQQILVTRYEQPESVRITITLKPGKMEAGRYRTATVTSEE